MIQCCIACSLSTIVMVCYFAVFSNFNQKISCMVACIISGKSAYNLWLTCVMSALEI